MHFEINLMSKLLDGPEKIKKKDSEKSPSITPSMLMPPLKLRRKYVIDNKIPDNHVLASLEAAQVYLFSFI